MGITNDKKKKFIRRYHRLVSRAFADGDSLDGRHKDVRDSEWVRKLISKAREQLGYAKSTYDLDIYRSLWRLKKGGIYNDGF